MTTASTTPARRPRHTLRRAVIIAAAALGMAVTTLPAAPAAQAAAPPVPTVHQSTVAQAQDRAQTYRAWVAVKSALKQRGKPYKWAGDGPSSFDCSGLTQYAFRGAGISLPHSSRAQSRMGKPVAKKYLRPGDLVFYYQPVGHVGIYIGNGRMVHAPSSGDVVKIAYVDAVPGYSHARRVY